MEEELLKKWDIHRIIQEAVKSSHYEPSSETKSRLKLLEDNQKKFMEKLDNFETKLDEIKELVLKMPKQIFDEGDSRYASKSYEQILKWIGGIIGSGILGYLGYLIVKLIEL